MIKKTELIYIWLDQSSFLAPLVRDCGQTGKKTVCQMFLNATENASEANHRSLIKSDRIIQI